MAKKIKKNTFKHFIIKLLFLEKTEKGECFNFGFFLIFNYLHGRKCIHEELGKSVSRA